MFHSPDPKALEDLVPALHSLARTSAIKKRPLSISLKGRSDALLWANRAESFGNGLEAYRRDLSGQRPMQLAEALLHVSGDESGLFF